MLPPFYKFNTEVIEQIKLIKRREYDTKCAGKIGEKCAKSDKHTINLVKVYGLTGAPSP